jgi:hypothetical protein
MNYNYLFLGIGLTISIYSYLLIKKNKTEEKEEIKLEEIKLEENKLDEYGFGYIIYDYPILTIYIKGYILNKKKNNLSQTSYPNGFPEDSYVLISFDENFTDYIGVVNVQEFKEIKKLLVDNRSEKIDVRKLQLRRDYFDIRNQFAEAQIKLLTF